MPTGERRNGQEYDNNDGDPAERINENIYNDLHQRDQRSCGYTYLMATGRQEILVEPGTLSEYINDNDAVRRAQIEAADVYYMTFSPEQ